MNDIVYIDPWKIPTVWLMRFSKWPIQFWQVIRDAGQKRKHHTVHPDPIDGQFDLVKGLFIPSPNQVRFQSLQSFFVLLPDCLQELSHYSFKYGYVTHTNQRGLYKIDLANMRYTRSVDLTPYNCVPSQVQFSALCKSITCKVDCFTADVFLQMVLF